MKITKCKEKIKVGDWVKTNGSGYTYLADWFEGEIGEIQYNNFYVWQNVRSGTIGNVSPSTKGYKYSWQIGFINPNEIKIIKTGGLMKTSLLERLLDKELALIKKYVMDDKGNLVWDNPIVQEALLETDSFRKILGEKLIAHEKELKTEENEKK